MGNKTIKLEDDIHIKLSEIQLNLRKVGIEITLREVCDTAVRCGIDNVFEIIKHEDYLDKFRSVKGENLNDKTNIKH